MKLSSYLKDKVFAFIMIFLSYLVLIFVLYLFDINTYLIIGLLFIMIVINLVILLNEYLKKKKFYDEFNNILDTLDKKYLINEVIKYPEFIEGKILLEFLYEIDKSYIETLNTYKYANDEFKDYIELWCHEIKTPIATSKLVLDNNKTKINENLIEEINRIENYVEQVLYYSKLSNATEDYIIKEINLKNIINEVIRKNKKILITKKVKINIFEEEIMIKSDQKWLSYIINQIIINSIKYSKEKNSIINITCIKNKNNIILNMEDNGIGIKEEELEKVFNKGYTGTNGRKNSSSTGMGLYLCKKLCEKLGYDILISSKEGIKTKVTIIFPKSSMISEIKE